MLAASDSQLVAIARAGNADAFAVLVERHQRLVVGVALAMTRDRALAEDIGQETFVAGWRGLAQLDDPARVASWLAGIARNLAANVVRKQARRKQPELESDVDPAPTPLDDVVSHELNALLRETLDELPDAQREALVLYYFEDRSIDHVAAGLGVSKDVVKQRLHRGREAARLLMTERLGSALASMRPAAAFTGAVMAAISLTAVTNASAATTSVATQATGGKIMFVTKLAIAATLATAGGVALYTAHGRGDAAVAAPTAVTAVAASPTLAAPHPSAGSMARVSLSRAEHQKLTTAVAAARQRRLAAPGLPTRPGAAPSLSESQSPPCDEHDPENCMGDYIRDAATAIVPLLRACVEQRLAEASPPALDGEQRLRVRCTVQTEPEVGAVVTSSAIVEGSTTVSDPAIRECVRETMYAIELDPAQFGGELTFETELAIGTAVDDSP